MRFKKLCALLLAVVLTLGLCSCGLSKEEKYDKAVADVKAGKYDRAIEAFESLKGYEDSEKYIMYARCLKTGDSGDYDTAIKSLTSMGDFKEAAMYIKYYTALAYEADESYEKAAAVYDEILLFKDVAELLNECNYQLALKTEAGGTQNAQAAYDAFKALGAYKDSAERVAAYETKYNDAISKEKAGEFDAAIALFTELGTFSNSSEWIIETQNAKAYAAAASLMASEKYEEAIAAFKALSGYRDSDAQITECSYLKAEELRENGQYLEACSIYLTIKGYRDVDAIIEKDENIAGVIALQTKFMAGNYVNFGSYPQTQNGNDNTPIEWLVLESDGETALLISRYALDCKPYNEKYEDTTWEKCTLRGWLNSEFFNKAFGAEEKQYILQSDVSADKNPKYSTNPGNATKDKVFLLSVVEVNKYFKSDDARMCALTDYAIQQGAYTSDSYKVEGRKACWWWLRSPGGNSLGAALVRIDGSISGFGSLVYSSDDAVRPCVRVRLF